jgi:hypothetical protein
MSYIASDVATKRSDPGHKQETARGERRVAQWANIYGFKKCFGKANRMPG